MEDLRFLKTEKSVPLIQNAVTLAQATVQDRVVYNNIGKYRYQ
jgi:hypothetical protein